MKFRLLLLLFLINGISAAYAQKKRCGTVEYQNMLYQKYPKLKEAAIKFEEEIQQKTAQLATARIAATGDTTKLYTIPVVVHIIHNSPSGIIGENGNISDQQILSQFPVSNNDWRRKNADTTSTPAMFLPVAADMNFEFCLASRDPNGNPTTGITRTYSSTASWDISDDGFKSLSYWPSDQYLNVWVVNFSNYYLGYSQLPYGSLAGENSSDPGATTDGIAVAYIAFGTIESVESPYNLGRTLTHEIGHWLGGLRHPWGDCTCCTDYVGDTPWQDSADYDYNPCQLRTTTCNGTIDTLMIQNYMQYTGDNCMNLFTQGQKQRSRISFWGCPRRVALLQSPGCCGQGTNASLPFVENFEQDNLLTTGWLYTGKDSLGWKDAPYGGYGTSTQCITIANTSADSAEDAYLVSPFINFQTSNVPYLKFDLSYAANSSSQTDTLVISYNSNCTDKWNILAKLYGNDLITTSKLQNNFTPQSTDWKTIYLDLPSLQGGTGTKVRFENRSAGANNIYIDNINFEVTSEEPQVTVYPNPTDGIINYKALQDGSFTVKAEVYNCLGKKLIEKDVYSAINSYTGTIDLSSLPAAMYLLRVNVNSKALVSKVIVNK